MHGSTPRPEYPRPQMVRDAWLNLNGPWQFAFDPDDRGLTERWHEGHAFDRTITVPFCPESPLSGIGDTGYHDVVWYHRTFTVPPEWRGQDVHLHIGACDFETHLYVNGRLVGHHVGGYTPITADVTSYLTEGENTITVRAYDGGADKTQPRGKQDWEPEPHAIWHTRTTGIWQTVWLEPVPPNHIADLMLTPEFDQNMLIVRAMASQFVSGTTLTVIVHDQDEGAAPLAQDTVPLSGNRARVALSLPDVRPWSPESPNLYPVTLRLESAAGADAVRSYFGMRKVDARDGKVRLNNEPYFLKLVLDHGLWPDGVSTAPTDEALRFDVQVAKEMGYNGARKHQKVEDPRWLYWADRLGFLVWGEMGNSYGFTPEGCAYFRREWPEAVMRDVNHPCVIAWVPFNESWGIEGLGENVVVQEYVRDIVLLTKRLDPTRLVVANDGWEQINETDIMGLHDYNRDPDAFHRHWAGIGSPGYAPAKAEHTVMPMAVGQRYNGQPIVITEFGGVPLRVEDEQPDETAQARFLERLAAFNRALLTIPGLAGYCYTMLTDVEQEDCGLLTYDRRPKAPLEAIRHANS
ncbi:MAG: glycoside hydrolase family 2 [Armatimonadetes bacterium]|nr:glycoside hydrolase family 2 [Armatimonadota bacterium]